MVNPPPYNALDPHPPPKYSEIAFDKDYRDPFYKKHLLYVAVGLYQHDSLETIRASMQAHFARAIAQTSDRNQCYGWGYSLMVMMASHKFADRQSKESYDKNGDPDFSIASRTIKDKFPYFYKNHSLYEAAGAQKNDDHEHILRALKNSAYRVLQDKRNSDTVQSEEVRTFKMLWYNACYTLMNKIRRDEYDTKSDKDYRFVIE